MSLLAHHIEIELFEVLHIAPETTLEHVCFFAATLPLLAVLGYGAWALKRDLVARWKGRRATGSVSVPAQA